MRLRIPSFALERSGPCGLVTFALHNRVPAQDIGDGESGRNAQPQWAPAAEAQAEGARWIATELVDSELVSVSFTWPTSLH